MADDGDWLARITPGGLSGSLVLRPGWVWEAASAEGQDAEALTLLAQWANLHSQPPYYEYSPADGIPGRRLASELAEEIGADVEFPDAPPAPKGAVY